MKKMLFKEMRLSASILSYIFIAASIQRCRENNDLVYSSLLPVAKRDIVRGKFAFALLIEGCGFLLMTGLTLLRMTVLADAVLYRTNALMNANFVFLGFALLVFGSFNLIFLGGFFKTAYYYGKPFVIFIIIFFVIVAIAEALHHIPGNMHTDDSMFADGRNTQF